VISDHLTNETDPVPLTLDLRITHDRFGSTSDPSLYGHFHCPNDIDRSLNETVSDKIREYHPDFRIYYESRNRETETRPIYECRCDERLKTKSEKSTRGLGYTGLLGELEL
jgi:hypothetical protein